MRSVALPTASSLSSGSTAATATERRPPAALLGPCESAAGGRRHAPVPGRRLRTAAPAVARSPRPGSRQPFLEALAPRGGAQLPPELPLGLGVGEAAPLGHR